jgi:hypothetical protein
LRPAVSILFVLVLLSKLAYSVFWLVKFELNKEEIIRMECVNRDKPELKCNGKCYLAKQLALSQEDLNTKKQGQQRSAEGFAKVKNLEFNHTVTPLKFKFELTESGNNKNFVRYTNHYSFERELQFFHPPCGVLAHIV